MTKCYKNLLISLNSIHLIILPLRKDILLKSMKRRNNSSTYSPTVQFSSVTQSFLTVCDPMDCSTPGLPVRHQLLEFIQTHVHWICDAIQPSHPLSSPSPPAFSLSQHQSLFQWISSSHLRPKDWSFSFSISPSNEYSGLISFKMDWLDLLASPGDSQESSPTPQ